MRAAGGRVAVTIGGVVDVDLGVRRGGGTIPIGIEAAVDLPQVNELAGQRRVVVGLGCQVVTALWS